MNKINVMIDDSDDESDISLKVEEQKKLLYGVDKLLVLEACEWAERRINQVRSSVLAVKPSYFYLPTHSGFNGLQPIHVEFKPTKLQYKIWAKEGFYPIFVTGAKHGPHAMIGAGRSICEHKIVELATQQSIYANRPIKMCDIGSNADRLRTAIKVQDALDKFDVIHHMIPLVHPDDFDRLKYARRHYSNVCTCKVEDCNHYLDMDVLIAQHSLYYIDPMDLFKIIGNRMLIASVHHIDDGYGNFQNGEMVYYVDEDGNANCLAKGNKTPYIHKMNDWLRTGRLYKDGMSLIWNLKYSVFDNHVYEFHIISQLQKTLEVHEDFTNGMVSALNGLLVNPIIEKMNHMNGGDLVMQKVIKVSLKYGTPIVYFGDNKVLIVPRELIGMLILKLAGVNRDQVSLGLAFDLAKRTLMTSSYPSRLCIRVITMAVCIAMTEGIEQTTGQMGRMFKIHNKLFSVHNAVLKGQPIEEWRWFHWFKFLNPYNACYMAYFDEEHHTEEALTYQQCRLGGIAPRIEDVITLPAVKFKPVYNNKSKILPPMDDEAELEILLTNPQKPQKDPTIELYLVSLGLSPTTCRRGTEALVQGLRTRVLRKTPVSNGVVWPDLIKMFEDETNLLHEFIADDRIIDSEFLFNKWVQRYPEHQRDVFRKARKNVQHHGVLDRYRKVSAFIKVEKSGMCDSFGPPDIDPRIIQSHTPECISITGPSLWEYGNRIRKSFRLGKHAKIVWVSGEESTSDGFGVDFKEKLDEFDRYFVYWGDFNKFEAHWDQDKKNFFIWFLSKIVDNTDIVKFFNVKKFKGKSQDNSVRYTIPYKLCSGGSWTALFSFLANLCSLIKAFGSDAKIYFWCHGDDFLVLTNVDLLVDFIKESFNTMGHVADVYKSENFWDVEFCQLVPYPVGNTIVWGPKIGRLLARIPWKTSSSSDPDPRGVMLGLRQSINHIPFLKEYCDLICRLVPKDTKPIDLRYKLTSSKMYDYDGATLAFVCYRYDLTLGDLENFQKLLNKVVNLVSVVHWDRLQTCCDKDV